MIKGEIVPDIKIECEVCEKETILTEHRYQKYYKDMYDKSLCSNCVEKLHDRIVKAYLR